MINSIEDIWTAIDRGYEEIANLEYEESERASISANVEVSTALISKSLELYALVRALEDLEPYFHTSPCMDEKIERIYNNVKMLTQKVR